jgi:hypothetical protein
MPNTPEFAATVLQIRRGFQPDCARRPDGVVRCYWRYAADRKVLAGHCGAMYPKCKSRLAIERGGNMIFMKGNDKTLDRRAEDEIRRSLMEGENW